MGLSVPRKHARVLTREELLRKYAGYRGITVVRAADVMADLDFDDLRQIVETIEQHRHDQAGAPYGKHQSFGRSLPTTSVQGQTR